MTADQREALRAAIRAYERDRDARSEELKARRALVKACIEAHTAGVSDGTLARAFGEYSRARIQQFRTKVQKELV